MNKLLENVMLQAIKQNPETMKLITEINKSGLSYKEYFLKKAEEMGVDPESILSQLR